MISVIVFAIRSVLMVRLSLFQTNKLKAEARIQALREGGGNCLLYTHCTLNKGNGL